ncbi:DUF3108 domain-containing protein [Pedobacter arcticus]|uniref:DUF3108 domain-containing protein n=1 Tax=Pedobacter arcticus TaxID=752140 RepID=UPI0002D3C110|nr:DUF3108 domain-containing protein [Pedobacter arcticus]
MKKLSILILALAFCLTEGFGQGLDYLNTSTFKEGETLTYKLKYGFLTAAEAKLRVLTSDVRFDNRPTYHLLVEGNTSGTFDIFYKVRNRYDSYIDRENFSPYLYTENVRENKYRRSDKARFYQDEKKIVAKKGSFKSPVSQTFDLVSAYYFMRNIDLTHVKVGDKITINYFLDDEVTPLTVEYFGKETIKTELGRIKCLKFSPSIRPGRVFKKDSRIYLWISDDVNRIPVKAQAEVIVGAINMEISSAKGLVKPLQTD